MAVTWEQKIPCGPDQWKLIWSSDLEDPEYAIYVNGEYLYSTRCNSLVVSMMDGESRTVEVLDVPGTRPTPAVNAQALLAWDAVEGAARYRVERYVNSEWVVVKTIEADEQRTHYETPPLAGGATAHEFRALSVGDNDNESDWAEVDITMVRRPDPPVISGAFSNSTKKVTIADAA